MLIQNNQKKKKHAHTWMNFKKLNLKIIFRNLLNWLKGSWQGKMYWEGLSQVNIVGEVEINRKRLRLSKYKGTV